MRIVIALALTCCSAFAFAADPQVTRLEPQGGQRGTTVAVDFVGERAGQEPLEVMLLDQGLKVNSIESVDANRARVTFEIPDNCQPGRHALRLRTSTGVSDLRTFHVGTLTEVKETEPNSLLAQAQAIEVGCVVNGLADREDVDYYVVELEAGERLAVEIEGLRLGRTFFDPALRITNEQRFELAASDDEAAVQQDAYCVITAPSAGRYFIEVRETAYRGDENCTYRLHVGHYPRPAMAYPPGGQIGETIEVNWVGDSREAWKQKVQLPGELRDKFAVFASDAGGVAPSPNYLRVVGFPVTQEVEPNNGRKQATAATAPGAMVGILTEPGDSDFFRFEAKKGQRFVVRSLSRELRSPIDTVIRLFASDGSRIAGNDDNLGLPDSLAMLTVPEDGEYFLQVADHLRSGGEAFVYWVEVANNRPRAKFTIAEQQQYFATLLEVPAGNRTAAMLNVRRIGISGDLAIDWQNLPPGVSVECPVCPASEGQVPVLLSAADDTQPAGRYVNIGATKIEGNEPVATEVKQQTWFVRGQNNRPVWTHSADRATVVTTKRLPFKLRLVEPKAPLVQRGVKRLKVVADRDEGFAEAIAVNMLYNPAGVSSNASLRIERNTNEIEIPLTASGEAAIGSFPIVMLGRANVNGRVVVATQMVDLTVAAPYLAMKLPRISVEQGNTIEFPVEVNVTKPFEGKAKVTLLRLPPGVTTEPVDIDKDTKQITFDLTVADDARPGQHKGQYCRVDIAEAGEAVVHSVGYGELRVDTPLEEPKPKAADRTAAK